MPSRAFGRTAPHAPLCLVAISFALACEVDQSTVTTGDSEAAFTLDILTVRDCPPPEYEKLSPDERLVGVEVEVRAKQRGVPANFYYGALSDAENNTYRPTASGCTPKLAAPPMAAGTTQRGFVNFKLPARATGLTFSYAPRLTAGGARPANSVALPLGR